MKTNVSKAPALLLSSAAIWLVAGCASTIKIPEPVGPTALSDNEGVLIVHHTVPYKDTDIYYDPQITSFEVVDPKGRQLETFTTPGDRVEEATIPAGKYFVTDGLGAERVQVEVEIVPGKVTEVFFGQTRPPPTRQIAGHVVRGPDGSFIGWRAEPAPNEKFVSAPHEGCPGSC